MFIHVIKNPLLLIAFAQHLLEEVTSCFCKWAREIDISHRQRCVACSKMNKVDRVLVGNLSFAILRAIESVKHLHFLLMG